MSKGTDNKILRMLSKPVKKIDRAIKNLVEDMIDTMRDAEGLGIAAPQVGVNLRIYIARLNYGTKNELIVPMINSHLSDKSHEMAVGEEGCLSIPGRFGTVERHESLTVEYTDIKGKKHTLNLTGLNARIMQHETDHLDGTLIADKMKNEVSAEEMRKLRAKK